MTAAEFVERLAKAPLAHQPGTVWEYSYSTAMLGRVIEAVSGKRLSMFLAERLFKPLNMPDSGFVVANEKAGQIAQQLLPSALTLFDPTITPANDLGGEGGLSTAMDYLRFSEMLLERGKLGGTRALSPTTIALMTSDHLGDRPSSRWGPANYCSACPVTRSGSASRSARAQASLGCQARRANTVGAASLARSSGSIPRRSSL